MKAFRPILLLVALLAVACENGNPEATVDSNVAPIAPGVPCSPCQIDTLTLVEIGDAAGPGIVSEYAGISMDGRGHVLVAYLGAGGRVLAFGEDGRFVREVGGQGEGPGEYRLPSAPLLDAQGRLVIFDVVQRRMTLLSHDLDVVATSPMPPYLFSMTGGHSFIGQDA